MKLRFLSAASNDAPRMAAVGGATVAAYRGGDEGQVEDIDMLTGPIQLSEYCSITQHESFECVCRRLVTNPLKKANKEGADVIQGLRMMQVKRGTSGSRRGRRTYEIPEF